MKPTQECTRTLYPIESMVRARNDSISPHFGCNSKKAMCQMAAGHRGVAAAVLDTKEPPIIVSCISASDTAQAVEEHCGAAADVRELCLDLSIPD